MDLPWRRSSCDYLADGLHYRCEGEQAFFFWTELAWTVVNVGLTWA